MRGGAYARRRCRRVIAEIAQNARAVRETLALGCLVRWKTPKACPSYLREKSWCRKAWDVLPFTVCLLHQVMLIDSCPHCHRAISWARKSVSVCRCGYDWRRVSRPVIDGDGELTAARRMLSIWREKAAGDFPLEDATVRPLTREISAVYPEALCALADALLFLKNKVRFQSTNRLGQVVDLQVLSQCQSL